MSARPVKPRNAASLVLVRRHKGAPHILMGRRSKKSVFPEFYVFPGGRVDKSDAVVTPSAHLSEQALNELCERGGCTPDLARALATAAIRETFEETGLLIANSGNVGLSEGTWAEFAARGVAPAHDRLRFIGRAITPATAPVRFHARFFVADGDQAEGDLQGNGELEALDWYPLDKALTLPAVDVTQFILRELHAAERGEIREAPFFRYRRNKPLSPAAND
jgi:8-oxo-dGTP pyrophosphatase MutT (NUDIX family)